MVEYKSFFDFFNNTMSDTVFLSARSYPPQMPSSTGILKLMLYSDIAPAH
jgi:hypothetical protein